MIRLQSAAKVNLSLDILSRRSDGYHELASVVHTVGIYDEIDLKFLETPGIEFSCDRDDLRGDDNLCVRAFQMWREAAGLDCGAKIDLRKFIPSGAGLGGGSGNAAAILRGANSHAPRTLSEEQLREVGARLGADVPLFLQGGAVFMEGIGEKLTPLSPLRGWLLIIKPEISISTPAAYKTWDAGGFSTRNDSSALLKSWKNSSLREIGAFFGNDLERSAAQMTPIPAQLTGLLRECGALGAQMSGSGSACFGIFESERETKNAAGALKSELVKEVHLRAYQLFIAPFCAQGVVLVP